MNNVAVIGLGKMGSTLARLLLEAGYRVTVWNRSADKVASLAGSGAVGASSAVEALRSSPVSVICVHDYRAAQAIFDSEGAAGSVEGRVLIQLSTGSPGDAREAEVWARAHGAEYVDGAIQAAPSQMGQADTPILVSGAGHAWQKVEPLFKVFGGRLSYLGEAVGAANSMDAATLSYIYGAFLGFVQGARFVEADGARVLDFATIVAGITPSYGEFLRHEGAVIERADYAVSESPLRISVDATERLARMARDAGLNTELPDLAASLFARAMNAGYGDQEAAALIKVLRE